MKFWKARTISTYVICSLWQFCCFRHLVFVTSIFKFLNLYLFITPWYFQFVLVGFPHCVCCLHCFQLLLTVLLHSVILAVSLVSVIHPSICILKFLMKIKQVVIEYYMRIILCNYVSNMLYLN